MTGAGWSTWKDGQDRDVVLLDGDSGCTDVDRHGPTYHMATTAVYERQLRLCEIDLMDLCWLG